MRDYFYERIDRAERTLRHREVLLADFAAEATDFVRFNRGRIRQPGSVRQAVLGLSLAKDGRRSRVTLTLGEGGATDDVLVAGAIAAMRDELDRLEPDPYLLFNIEPLRIEHAPAARLPSADEALDTVLAAAAGHDLVGIFASGPVYRGFASSLGARCWHAVGSSMLDWSVYLANGRAVKRSTALADWDRRLLADRIERSLEELGPLAREPVALPPGEYRAYLAPAAVDEIVSMLGWDGVSAKAQRTHQSPLQRLVEGEAMLSPLFDLAEDFAAGLAPGFDAAGFARPSRVELVQHGRHAGSLVSARTAREYGIACNGANEQEALQSASLGGGSLATADALAALGHGLYLSNLWYLNYSDRAAARITGMTRFACFTVRGGRLDAPIQPARFDDSLYRIFGERLEALTGETEWRIDPGTYEERSVRSGRFPGALVGGLRITL